MAEPPPWKGEDMLLDITERNLLPPLYSQEKEEDPVIHVKIEDPERNWACYIAEGGLTYKEYEVFALFVGRYGSRWGQVPVSVIEKDLLDAGISAESAQDFTPARISSLGLKKRGGLH
jgi:hypothetical protein